MPGRVSTTRSSRSSAAASQKPASQTLTSRTSTMSRVSTSIRIPEEGSETPLRVQISTIFRDAQRSTASHRKLVNNLRKIQETCCYEPANHQTNGDAADRDESDFANEVIRCILRVMPVRRSEGVGERTIKFIGMFLRHATEKDSEILPASEDDTAMMIETPSTRLVGSIVSSIVPLLTSKDKFVRYRSTQLISHLVNSLDSMDDELFHTLRHGLVKRIRDKEAMVRVQAVLGLGRLAGNEVDGEVDSDDSEDSGAGLLEKLLDVLQNDPSADVRRALLVNLPILPNTLPFLLERARDQDAATRRALYSRLLPALGDFRHLSLSMREKLLRWGLRDRDENVRKAAGRLFRERWIEDCVGAHDAADGEVPSGPAPPNLEALLELLERIDVVNSGVENGVALEAMKGFWEGRPDYRDALQFDDHFWETLSAESVFVARSFQDFCRSSGQSKLEELIEMKMPEVTKIAYYLQRYIEVLVEAIKRVASEEPTEELEEEEDTVEQEFIVEQLLHMSRNLDYSDEAGRRQMFALLRQSLSIPDLPEEVTKLIVEVLRSICASDVAGEREFISVVLEAVADIHDTIMDDANADESFHSAKSEVSEDAVTAKKQHGQQQDTEEETEEKAVREIMVNMKCLHVVQCMLQNVDGNLQQNTELVAMLNNLVVPAVRSHEAPVRERGLLCMGLCSLLDKSLAEENLTLFMHFFSQGHAALQITALQIITDILTQHGAYLLDSNAALLKVYIKALKNSSKKPDVQAAATISVCKLMLGRIVSDSAAAKDLLRTLVIAYFDPATQSNQSVRQTLSYFLPVYCYSRVDNQDRMRQVVVDAIHALHNLHENLDDEADDSDMVSISTIGAHLLDWTDPRKCYSPDDFSRASNEDAKKSVNGNIHLDLAKDILDKLNSNATRDEKKLLAPLLGKIYVSPTSSEDKIRELFSEVSIAVDDRLIADATGRNALYKIHVSLGKLVNGLDEKLPRSSIARDVAASPTPEFEVPNDANERAVNATAPGADTEQDEEEEEEDTIMGGKTELTIRTRDSLVAELLSDEEEL